MKKSEPINKILKRILHEAGSPELLEILTDRLSQADLQSLLLEVYRMRVVKLSPGRLLSRYAENRFVRPSGLKPLEVIKFDSLAYSLLSDSFEPIELSPVCPLGTVSAVTNIDQNNTLTTIRNTEVCSDSTNVLALECASRRRIALSGGTQNMQRIKLCASQRQLRTQMFNEPAAVPHFRLFGLVTSGRDEGHLKFEIENLIEHIEFYIRLLGEAGKLGLVVEEKRFVITALDEQYMDMLRSRVLDVLSSNYSELDLQVECNPEAARGYYSQVRFQAFARDGSGEDLLLIDGGFTDWTQKLLSDRKERLLISGIGTERMFMCFVP